MIVSVSIFPSFVIWRIDPLKRARHGLCSRLQLSSFGDYLNKEQQLFDSIPQRVLYKMFGKIPERGAPQLYNSVSQTSHDSCNSVVVGFAKQGLVEEVLQFFARMNCFGIQPTKFTLCTVLNSCSKLLYRSLGLQIHAQVIRMGYDANLFLCSALVDLYAKLELLADAKRVFNYMHEHDQVSWTSMISGFSQNGHGDEAFQLFKQMLHTSIRPNCFTFASIISGCNLFVEPLDQGTQLHACVVKIGFEANSFIICSLIDFYSKCGKINDARILFDANIESDTTLCNSMIAGYSQNLHGEEALKLFAKMQKSGSHPTSYTFSSLLNACGSLAVLEQGKQIHSLIDKMGFDQNVFVASSLVDMYAKCGSIHEARQAFGQTPEKNSVLWTSMITAYAQNGREEDGLELFEKLVKEGFKPDHICFTGVLTACNHGGFLDKGIHYFNLMKSDYGLTPQLDQFACMIDLYGRSGHLTEAKYLLREMPFEPNAIMWSSFLGSCRVYGEIELATEAAEKLFKLDLNSGVAYVTLANIYAEAGRWEESERIRKLMKYKGVRKRKGCSWIEVEKTVHIFSVNDRSHPQSEEIYAELDKVIFEMREFGYAPLLKYVLEDVEIEEKE